MSELSDRVDAIKKQQAQRAREEHERSLGELIRKPTKEETPLIREFLHNYKGPWRRQDIWAPDGKDRIYDYPAKYNKAHSKRRWRRNNIREVECVDVSHSGNWDDGSTLILIIFLDGRVSGQERSHKDLVEYLPALLAM